MEFSGIGSRDMLHGSSYGWDDGSIPISPPFSGRWGWIGWIRIGSGRHFEYVLVVLGCWYGGEISTVVVGISGIEGFPGKERKKEGRFLFPMSVRRVVVVVVSVSRVLGEGGRDAVSSSRLDGLVCGGVVVSSPGVWGDKYLDDGRWKDFPGIVGGGRLLVGIL
ncbi:uncharacterized protein BO96DRAFT_440020 [Aspergillus niger CBS 101883]|uniref:Uncharacterized protein n=2 Tax=Aspergillus niger TaxID=5061 RepID=A2QV53_ASPNC|nr:uncharacterized protein BO96DRAFT_440020 [Aspergillus niger CBS 101883]XP_059601518.1 hypothetical protein An10g01050 [Aspergillus niger]PYH50327.1 hypothetical protein BO96DRAFT_440020 [Aspergillus niger CBS 101883]CAK40540.1 hypothetical protein An10g01050 [Aspergillus niger]